MSQIKILFDELKEREKDIFPNEFAKSGLTAKDITAVSKELKIKFPASFKTFICWDIADSVIPSFFDRERTQCFRIRSC